MPSTDNHGHFTPFASIGRSIMSIRRDQVHTADAQNLSAGLELEAFQKHVSDIFLELAEDADELLSLPWIRKLLDSFLICLEEFRVILFNSTTFAPRSPLDRIMSEYFDRGVKALDICNAVRNGIYQIGQWREKLEIVLVCLDSSNGVFGEGQKCRARKSLADLSALMLDEKDDGYTLRNRSFSWKISTSKQLQAISNNLNTPKGNEISATNGIAVAVFTINNVLLFTMWTIAACIPCLDRGFQIHFSIPRSYCWSSPILSLHDCIIVEAKKKGKKNAGWMLKEVYQIEKLVHRLTELLDKVNFPLSKEMMAELKQGEQELARILDVLKDELKPLERQIREVFHRIVLSRAEGINAARKVQNFV